MWHFLSSFFIFLLVWDSGLLFISLMLLFRTKNLICSNTFPGLGIRSSVFWANRSFFAKKMSEWAIRSKKSNSLDRSFLVSDLSKSLMVAHLSWATWASRSQLLICPERSEWISHSRSFDLSDLSKWANEQIPNPAFFPGYNYF